MRVVTHTYSSTTFTGQGESLVPAYTRGIVSLPIHHIIMAWWRKFTLNATFERGSSYFSCKRKR